MSSVALKKANDNVLAVHGALTFYTVHQLLEESETAIKNADAGLVFDLADVSQCDSASLALLIHWLRLAHEYDTTIQYINMPMHLQRLAKMSNISDLLG